MIDKREWIWMGHPAHFICAHDCRFHLATVVGKYIISTVGEHLPDAPVREIIAKSTGVKLEGKGDARLVDFLAKCDYQDIGYERKFETMVFEAVARDEIDGVSCCPYRPKNGRELEMQGYNEASMAALGHMQLCLAYAEKQGS